MSNYITLYETKYINVIISIIRDVTRTHAHAHAHTSVYWDCKPSHKYIGPILYFTEKTDHSRTSGLLRKLNCFFNISIWFQFYSEFTIDCIINCRYFFIRALLRHAHFKHGIPKNKSVSDCYYLYL